MMFSTSTPLFNSDSPEENPEPSDSNSEDNDSDDEEARAKRREYWEKVDEREELGREYKRLNDIDSRAEDDREREYGSDDGSDEYITEEMRRAKQALIDKTEEFKSKDHEVKEAKEAYEKMTGKTLPEPE